jgi:quercetin dioxygenase-like cupin family protein
VNSEKDGPGVPLPAGRVRCFQPDDSGALQFVGEAAVKHTPVDEKFTLEVGYAFDLAAERKTLAERRPSEREREFDVEVRLRNHKPGTATVTVEEPLGGETTILRQSHPSTRKDSNTVRFAIEVPAGKEIATHRAPGPITVHCLAGRVVLVAHERSQELDAGSLVFLATGEPHSLRGIEDATLLVTIVLPAKDAKPRVDVVQEASEESFPASDSPAY